MNFELMSIFWAVTICLVSHVTGNTTFTSEGEDIIIQWTISPEPGNVVVAILNPSDEVLYSVLRTSVIPGTGNNSDRVINTDNTNTNTGHIEFTLNNVTVADAGDYKARFDRGDGNLIVIETGVTLVVYNQPSTPVLTVVTSPVVGQEMVLQCSAASNSKPDGQLTMKYKWYLNGKDLQPNSRYVASGTQLQVKNIQKSDKNSKFTCIGYENSSLLSNASNEYAPNVQYKPENLIIEPNKETYVLLESKRLGPIKCSAACNPDCTYKWKRNGVEINHESVLDISKINRQQTGNYKCEAENTHGIISSRDISVTVEYPPENTILTINSNTEIKENDPLPMSCTTDSVPSSDMTIWLEGDEQRILHQRKSTLKIDLKKSAECHDNGKIFCDARNKYGQSKSNKTSITVFCSPRLKNGILSDRKISIGKSESLNITGVVIAYPLPDISWTFRHDDDSDVMAINNETIGVEIYTSSNHVTYSSQVVRRSIKVEDFGNYVMNASNLYGSIVLKYYVFSQQPSDEEPSISVALIGGIAGGVSALLIIIIILAVVFMIKRRKSKKDRNTEHVNSRGMEMQDEPDEGMKRNILYESAGDLLERPNDSAAEYATVDKSAKKQNNSVDVYAVVDKKGKKPGTSKSKTKGDTYDNLGGDFDDDIANIKPSGSDNGVKAANGKTPSRKKNKDGLVYIDVVTGSAGKSKQNGIHGIEKKVEYVDVDFTKRADPLPSDDDEDDIDNRGNDDSNK